MINPIIHMNESIYDFGKCNTPLPGLRLIRTQLNYTYLRSVTPPHMNNNGYWGCAYAFSIMPQPVFSLAHLLSFSVLPSLLPNFLYVAGQSLASIQQDLCPLLWPIAEHQEHP